MYENIYYFFLVYFINKNCFSAVLVEMKLNFNIISRFDFMT